MVGKNVERGTTTARKPVHSGTSAQPVCIIDLTEQPDNRSTASRKRNLDYDDQTSEQSLNKFSKLRYFTDGRKVWFTKAVILCSSTLAYGGKI